MAVMEWAMGIVCDNGSFTSNDDNDDDDDDEQAGDGR